MNIKPFVKKFIPHDGQKICCFQAGSKEIIQRIGYVIGIFKKCQSSQVRDHTDDQEKFSLPFDGGIINCVPATKIHKGREHQYPEIHPSCFVVKEEAECQEIDVSERKTFVNKGKEQEPDTEKK